MPLASERIANRPLSGSEVKQRILADVKRVLDHDNMFADYLAYGSVSYKVSVEMSTSNPFTPSVKTAAASGDLDAEAELRGGAELTRSITSPNTERIAMGLPLKIYNSTGVSQEIEYGKEMIPDYQEPPVVDTTAEVRKKRSKK